MLHDGISGHFQALAYVLKRRIKSVFPEKKKTQKVGVAGFDSLRNVYIYFFTKVTVSSRKTAHLSYISHEIQILRAQMGVSIPHLNF